MSLVDLVVDMNIMDFARDVADMMDITILKSTINIVAAVEELVLAYGYS